MKKSVVVEYSCKQNEHSSLRITQEKGKVNTSLQKGKNCMEDEGVRNRREYYRQWRANNKERVREYNARYWAKRAERMAQEQAAGKEVQRDDDR